MSDFALDEILMFHYLDLTWSDLIYMCVSVHLQTVEGLLGFRRHIVSTWPPFFIYRELKQFLFKMLCQKCIWSTLLDPFNQYQKLCISVVCRSLGWCCCWRGVDRVLRMFFVRYKFEPKILLPVYILHFSSSFFHKVPYVSTTSLLHQKKC